MKILGGNSLLDITETTLLYQYWNNQKNCLDILSEPNVEKVMDIISKDITHGSLSNSWFSVWVCDNRSQLYPVFDEYSDVFLTDINVVGDASPNDTLWFAFDKEERVFLDKILSTDINKALQISWEECIDISSSNFADYRNKEQIKQAKHVLMQDCYNRNIVDAFIELNFKNVLGKPPVKNF